MAVESDQTLYTVHFRNQLNILARPSLRRGRFGFVVVVVVVVFFFGFFCFLTKAHYVNFPAL